MSLRGRESQRSRRPRGRRRAPTSAPSSHGRLQVRQTPIDGRITDVNRFAQLGRRGRAGAPAATRPTSRRPGSTASESTSVRPSTRSSPRPRGASSWPSFASHIHRVQQAVQIAHLHGRKFARVRALDAEEREHRPQSRVSRASRRARMIKLAEIDDYRPEEILILSTGSQGEPLSALYAHGVQRPPSGGAAARATPSSSRPRPMPGQRGRRHDDRQPTPQVGRHGHLRRSAAACTSAATPRARTCA